jgi:hypothetical protein
MQQFLTEAIVLGLIGGALGMLLAEGGIDLLDKIVPASICIPNSNADVMRPPLVIDRGVLLFTLAGHQPCFRPRAHFRRDSRRRPDSAARPQPRFRHVFDQIHEIPGVGTAAIGCSIPLDEEDHKTDFLIEGRPRPPLERTG